MTINLKNMFEEQLKRLKRGGSSKQSGRPNGQSNARGLPSSAGTSSSGPSTSRACRRARRIEDDDEDGEVDVVNGDTPSTSTATPKRRVGRPKKASAKTNGVSSSQALGSSTARRRRGHSDDRERGSESDSSGTDSSSASTYAESGSIAISQLGLSNKRVRNRRSSDSDNSYTPKPKKRAAVVNGRHNGTKRSTRYAIEDEDTDDDNANGRSNLPRKRGRPRRSAPVEDDNETEQDLNEEEEDEEEDDEEQNSSDDNAENEEAPHVEPDEEDEEEDEEEEETAGDENAQEENGTAEEIVSTRTRRSRRRLDSDQSYRQSPIGIRSVRQQMQHSDDSDNASNQRPTRRTLRLAKASWGRDEDSLEENHDDEVTIPRPSTSRVTAASSQSQESRRRGLRRPAEADNSNDQTPGQDTRSIRSSRLATTVPVVPAEVVAVNGNGQHNDEDDDDSDDDQALSQFVNNRNTRPRRTYRKSRIKSIYPDRNEYKNDCIPEQAASSASTTTAAAASSTQGSPLSRTRELLRRRQPPVGPAPVSSNTPNAETSRALSHVQRDHDYGEPGPSTLRNTRRMLSRHQRNPDELDNSSSVAVDPLRLPTESPYVSGRLRHRNNRPASSFTSTTAVPDPDPDDEATDPEDNKPLHLMVTESPQRNRHSMRNVANSSSTATLSSLRGSRSLKRPYYNEDSDESIRSSTNHRVNGRVGHSANGNQHKRRLLAEDDDDDDDHSYTPNRRTGAALNGRSVTRARHNYDELTNSDDDGDTEEECQISVSSRGRVRRISSKVRGYFRDN